MGYSLNKQNGMTLIEVLLYITISSIVMISLSSFTFMVTRSRIKSQTVLEVKQQGRQILDTTITLVKNAKIISEPTPGNTSSTIVLTSQSGEEIRLFVNDQTLYLENDGEEEIITSSNVIVTEFIIKNLSTNPNFPLIRIESSISHINPENKMEYNFSDNFFTSIAVKDDYN